MSLRVCVCVYNILRYHQREETDRVPRFPFLGVTLPFLGLGPFPNCKPSRGPRTLEKEGGSSSVKYRDRDRDRNYI